MASIALITGAGSGIGETIEKFNAADNMTAIPCDITDEKSVDNLLAQIVQQHQRLDVVFNNAGNNVPPMPIDELTVDQWRTVIDVNLHGAFLVARAAFAQMRKQDPQGGRIINNGSISAHVPRPGSVPYTVSKHAITGLTRTLSLDGRAFNIACGQIDIGNAASAMTEKMNAGVPQADGSIKPEPTMDTVHIADAVVNMANLPLSANVQFMTIMSTSMPFIGRG